MQLRRMRSGVTLIALTIWLAACSGGPASVFQALPSVAATPSVAASLPATASPPGAATPPPSQVPSPSPSVDQSVDPRLEGRYTVLKKVTAKRNFTGIEVGDVLHRTYRVAPTCPIGPCGGFIKINLAETDQNISRRMSYDAASRTYSLVPISTPVICTGVNGRRYTLKTTDTIVITPVKSSPTLVDVVVTDWTGKEVVRAVPHGPALDQGHCKTAVIEYSYTGTRST